MIGLDVDFIKILNSCLVLPVHFAEIHANILHAYSQQYGNTLFSFSVHSNVTNVILRRSAKSQEYAIMIVYWVLWKNVPQLMTTNINSMM